MTHNGALALVAFASLAAGVLLFSITSLASPETGGPPADTPPALETPTATPTMPPVGEPTATPTNTPPAPPACPPASVVDDVFSDVLPAPLSIPDDDPTGVTDCISVSDMGTINDLNVVLTVRHPYVGDLIVTLTHEGTGKTVTLIDRPGVPAIDEVGCAGGNIDATLDDEASSPIEDECGLSTPTIFGSFTPNEPLAAFNGESMAGAWTITISDNASFDLGTLNSWSLIASLKTPTPTATPTPRPTPTPTEAPPNGDVNCNGGANSIDAALVLQNVAGLLAIGSLLCGHNADVDQDGSVTSIDAALILQFTAGLLGSLPP